MGRVQKGLFGRSSLVFQNTSFDNYRFGLVRIPGSYAWKYINSLFSWLNHAVHLYIHTTKSIFEKDK